MRFLLNLLPIFDWLLYQQGLIMLPCWQQICAFQLLLFWYKLAQFLGGKLELFHNSSVMKSLTVWHFSSYYFIYRKATSVLLKVHGFMDVYVAFLN